MVMTKSCCRDAFAQKVEKLFRGDQNMNATKNGGCKIIVKNKTCYNHFHFLESTSKPTKSSKSSIFLFSIPFILFYNYTILYVGMSKIPIRFVVVTGQSGKVHKIFIQSISS